jgi:two-component system sensor histidine kinase BaeS
VLPLVQLVMSSLSAVALHGEVELSLPDDSDDGLAGGLCAMTDPVRLEQVLTNLVGHAVKFTRPGGQVAVRVASVGDSITVAVLDTGIGIEPEALEHVFDRFYRATALADGIKGTGLGLSIARQMVEAQGGTLTVSSVLGQGSTFTVTLPAA